MSVERNKKLARNLLIFNIAGLVLFIILANINFSLKRRILNLTKEIEKPVSQESLSQLKSEAASLSRKLAGLTDIFDAAGIQEEVIDEGVFFAQKIDGIEKRLLRKSELKGFSPAVIEISRGMPSQEEFAYLIRQVEILEKAVDLGLERGVGFSSIKLLGLIQERSLDKMQIGIKFTGFGPDISEYMLSLIEFLPLLTIEEFKVQRKGAYEAELRLGKFLLDKNVLQPLIKGIRADDYRDLVSLSNEAQGLFSKNSIFKKIEVKDLVAVDVAKDETVQKLQRFFYRGIGKLGGKEVAAIEDTLKAEVLFLGEGEKIGDFKVKEFREGLLILEDIKTPAKKLILKREVD